MSAILVFSVVLFGSVTALKCFLLVLTLILNEGLSGINLFFIEDFKVVHLWIYKYLSAEILFFNSI